MFKTFPEHVARKFIDADDMSDALQNSLHTLNSRQISAMRNAISDAEQRAHKAIEAIANLKFAPEAMSNSLVKVRRMRRIERERAVASKRAQREQAFYETFPAL